MFKFVINFGFMTLFPYVNNFLQYFTIIDTCEVGLTLVQVCFVIYFMFVFGKDVVLYVLSKYVI